MDDDAAAAHGLDLLGLALGRSPGAGDLDEAVDFEVYFDDAVEARERGQAVPFLRARLCEIFELLGADLDKYLWHRDRFILEVDLGANSDDEEPKLSGHVRVGDGSEDEWFIVHLLRRLTSMREDIACRVVDSDGELLLIEAALVAPRWLEPSNAENRCWLRGGQVHFLPRPRPPEPDEITSRQALQKLRAAAGATCAKEKVQRAIDARLQGYPQKAIALARHFARAVLPSKVARILIAYPQLVAVALDHLPPTAASEMARQRKELTGEEASVRLDCDGLEPTDMACVGIRFTRCQYARIAGLRCQLPQRFTQRHWKAPQSAANDTKAMRLGQMLCAGLETAFLQDPEAATAALRWPGAITALRACVLPEQAPWWNDGSFTQHSLNLDPPLDPDAVSAKRAFLQQSHLDASFQQQFTKLFKNTAIINAVDLDAHWRDCDDSEDWLHVSAEDLDQEMQQRQAEFDAYDLRRGGATASTAAPAGDDQPDVAKLQGELAAMGQRVSNLLGQSSEATGIDAAVGSAAATGTKSTESDSDSEESDMARHGEGGFDVLGQEDDEDDEGSDEDAENGAGAESFRAHLSELDEQLGAVLDDRAEDPSTGALSGDGVPLRSHHVKVHGADPLDLDLHVMEHLLTSFCSEHSLERGPASLLLGELGLAAGAGAGAARQKTGGYSGAAPAARAAAAGQAPGGAAGLDGMD